MWRWERFTGQSGKHSYGPDELCGLHGAVRLFGPNWQHESSISHGRAIKCERYHLGQPGAFARLHFGLENHSIHRKCTGHCNE